jgi:hypothetical protein
MCVERSNIDSIWKYLKKNITKEDVEKTILEMKEYYPGMDVESDILGFGVNRTISKFIGGGTIECLLRIENDFAKYLGYTFETQLDNLEKSGHPNTITPLK